MPGTGCCMTIDFKPAQNPKPQHFCFLFFSPLLGVWLESPEIKAATVGALINSFSPILWQVSSPLAVMGDTVALAISLNRLGEGGNCKKKI